jgi:hypothetical protein
MGKSKKLVKRLAELVAKDALTVEPPKKDTGFRFDPAVNPPRVIAMPNDVTGLVGLEIAEVLNLMLKHGKYLNK